MRAADLPDRDAQAALLRALQGAASLRSDPAAVRTGA